jgi:hypothetical protein
VVIRTPSAVVNIWGYVLFVAIFWGGAAWIAQVGGEARGTGRTVLLLVFVLPLVGCGVWAAAVGVRMYRRTEILRAVARPDGVELRARVPRVQLPVSVAAGSRLHLARVENARDEFANWERGIFEYELTGTPSAWRLESRVALTSTVLAPLTSMLASHSITLDTDVGVAAGEPVAEAAPVLPGQPQDVMVVADMGQGSLWAYRKADPPRDPKQFALGAPVAWNSSSPTMLRVTVDQPEYFNENLIPAWDLPKPADMLAIHEFGGAAQATIPVPGGFSEVHAYVMRKGVKPRVVVYLKPLSDTQDR